MTDTFTLPVDGWADEWLSYSMSIIGAVVAFIRDHGPVADDRVLPVIRRASIGADVRKASPDFNEDDGARRILNLLVTDINAITRTDDGLLTVPPNVTEVVSVAKGRTLVPTADDRAANAARARHTEHLRRWVFKSPFATDWRDGIRRWSDDDVFAMAERITAIGYCGPAIVCDQHGVIIDGHLRVAALRLLDIDPDLHTEMRLFDDDLHRLAYVIAVHQQGKAFPADLKNAIVGYVNRAAKGSKETVSWPDDIPTLIGRPRQTPPVDHGKEVPPPVTLEASPVPPPAPPAPKSTGPKTVDLNRSQRQVVRLLDASPEPPTADALAAQMGRPRDHVSPRLAELRRMGAAEVVGRKGNQVWALTDAGRHALNRTWRPPLTADRPGARFKDSGPRPQIATRLIQASRYVGDERWITRDLLTGGSAKCDYVLRRTGWFTMNEVAWLFIPDNLAEDFTKARVRRLVPIEVGGLQAAFIRGESAYWDEWERLIRAELTDAAL